MQEEPKHWQLDSPLLRPWYHEPDLKYPKDFSPMTRSIGSFEDCGYEAEMGELELTTDRPSVVYHYSLYRLFMNILGTSLQTSKLVLTSLNESQWLDTDTDAIFFEQTYYNGNTNSFLMLRISWEHVKGGLYQGKAWLKFLYPISILQNSGQLRIKQLVYQNAKDSNKVFYCYLIFFANFLLQLLKFIKQAVVGPRNWNLLTITVFLLFDTMTLYYLVMTTLKINQAIDEFQLGKYY